jgi:uncharacterized membrane-anchored protein
MAKRKKPSELFKTARNMGENVGKLVLGSKEQSRILARRGKKGLKTTAETLEKAGKKAERKAMITTKETIPQIMKEFKKGLRKGMKKKR